MGNLFEINVYESNFPDVGPPESARRDQDWNKDWDQLEIQNALTAMNMVTGPETVPASVIRESAITVASLATKPGIVIALVIATVGVGVGVEVEVGRRQVAVAVAVEVAGPDLGQGRLLILDLDLGRGLALVLGRGPGLVVMLKMVVVIAGAKDAIILQVGRRRGPSRDLDLPSETDVLARVLARVLVLVLVQDHHPPERVPERAKIRLASQWAENPQLLITTPTPSLLARPLLLLVK